MSSSRATSRTVGRSAGRLLVLLAALAGLFAMHGLSEHGAGAHASMDGMAVQHLDQVAAHAEPAAAAVAAAVDGAAQHGMGAMGLCVAVLGIAVLLLLPRARGHEPGRLELLRGVVASVPAHTRAPDPPDLFRLSIQRC